MPLAGGHLVTVTVITPPVFAKVAHILGTFFHGYIRDIIFWAPLLAYAFVRGDRFVESSPGYGMPVSDDSMVWQKYDFHSFAEDGLRVVRRSENSEAEPRRQRLPTSCGCMQLGLQG